MTTGTAWGGLTLAVEIEFTAGVWTDITDYVRGFDTVRGRGRNVDFFQAGSAHWLLKNLDGRFTSQNSSGPYFGKIKPGIRIRAKGTYSATTYPIWFGTIDSWDDRYPGQKDATTLLTSTDGSRAVSSFTGTPLTTPTGDSETPGARIRRILI